MNEFKSRSDRNREQIESFLDSNQKSTEMFLYSREISTLSKRFPQIIIKKGERYKKELELYCCKVFRANP